VGGNTVTNYKGKNNTKLTSTGYENERQAKHRHPHRQHRTAARHPANSKKYHRSSKHPKSQPANKYMAARDHTSVSPEGPRIPADNPRAKIRPRPLGSPKIKRPSERTTAYVQPNPQKEQGKTVRKDHPSLHKTRHRRRRDNAPQVSSDYV
jgi:hypothetical protein